MTKLTVPAGKLEDLGSGVVKVTVDAGSGGDITTDAAWAAAGDLIVGSGNNTAAVLTKGTDGDVLTMVSGAVAWEAPAAGGLTHSFIGYNTVGASTETVTERRWYLKQVTPGSDGLIVGIGIYVAWQEDYLYQITGMVASDSGSNTPKLILAETWTGPSVDLSGTGGNTYEPRWYHMPIAFWATGSTKYWIGFQMARTAGGGTYPKIYYDGSGTDRIFTPGGFYQGDPVWGNNTSQSDSTRKYSIRADFIV